MSHARASAAEQPVIAAASQYRSWACLGLAVGCALSYVTFFVLPYYVNDMGRYPLREVASAAHDASLLWPYNTSLAVPFGLGAFATLIFGPFVAGGVLIWAVAALGLQSGTAGSKLRLVLASAVSAAILVWLRSDFGSALINWWLD